MDFEWTSESVENLAVNHCRAVTQALLDDAGVKAVQRSRLRTLLVNGRDVSGSPSALPWSTQSPLRTCPLEGVLLHELAGYTVHC